MDSHEIEKQIRDLLANESNCWTLSGKLFCLGGLFSLLGPTLEDRQRVGRSSLFKDAQKRIRELQRQRAQLLRGYLKRFPVGAERIRQA